ncbi:MAG: hypothetical protein WBE11_01950 [Candidatus Aminicenantaceae bacterium]
MLDKTRMLIKGGTVVLGHAVSQQNVFIQGEKIVDVGDLSDIKDVYKIDATGLLLLPEARGAWTIPASQTRFFLIIQANSYMRRTIR